MSGAKEEGRCSQVVPGRGKSASERRRFSPFFIVCFPMHLNTQTLAFPALALYSFSSMQCLS